jgi:hypothetical protein
MLTALCTVNRFQCIAALYREQISKQWELAPRLLACGLISKNGEKSFKIRFVPTYVGPIRAPRKARNSSRPNMKLVGPRFRRSGERLTPALAAPEPVRVSPKSRDCDECAIRLPKSGEQASFRFRHNDRTGDVSARHHRDVCEYTGHSAKAGWPAGYSPLGSHSAPGELLTTFLTLAAKWHRQDRGSDPWLDFCCGGGLK